MTNNTTQPTLSEEEMASLSPEEQTQYRELYSEGVAEPEAETAEATPAEDPETTPDVLTGRMEIDDDGVSYQVYDCPEPGCYRTFPTIQGLIMHRQRVHVSDDQKAEWARKRSLTAAARRETARQARELAAESPEVLAVIEDSLQKGTKAYEARRKRYRNAKHRGWTDERFNARELERARAAVASDRLAVQRLNGPGPGRPPGVKDAGPRVSRAAKNESQKADQAFTLVANATKALLPDPAVLYDHFEEVAELRQFLFQFLTRLEG